MVMTVLFSGIAAATIVAIASWVWQASASPNVRFLLPNDFEGPFVIVSQSANRTTWNLPRDVIFTIPDNGVLVVPDDSALLRWHAEYVSTLDRAINDSMPGVNDGHVGRGLAFLSKGMIIDGGLREHWFYFGRPAADGDQKKTRTIEELIDSLR
jgi:hypothetical protein